MPLQGRTGLRQLNDGLPPAFRAHTSLLLRKEELRGRGAGGRVRAIAASADARRWPAGAATEYREITVRLL